MKKQEEGGEPLDIFECLQKKTVAELKVLAKEKGLKVSSKMRKGDIVSLISGNKDNSVLDEATKILADRIQKEINEAIKNAKKEVEIFPAITKNPPRLLDGDILINSKLIRPGLIEAVFPLAEDLYMVSYFVMQKDCIIVCCCWDHILDFLNNGVELKGSKTVIKKYFQNKYPYFSSIFQSKKDLKGNHTSNPYLISMAWGDEQPKWYLTARMYDIDFPSMVYYGIQNDEQALEMLFQFRNALDKMWKEIEKSDAKAPKALMKEYFGINTLSIDNY